MSAITDRHVNERARAGGKFFPAHLKCDLAFEHVERLIFTSVQMRRRTTTRQNNGFEHCVAPICLLALTSRILSRSGSTRKMASLE